jgi:hypothetical protein
MKFLLVLVIACAACDEDGLVGPVPGGEIPCDPEIDVDGGADASVFAEDHVVAAADLTRLSDGSFAAAVERWDGTVWTVGVAFSDTTHTKLEWNLGAPPAGTTPPTANPRLAVSAAGQPALLWREAAGTLALGTRTAKTTLAGSGGVTGGVIAWADAQTPAAAWISPDGTQLVSSLGPIATAPRWMGLAATSQPGGGMLIIALGPHDLVFFVEPAAGGAPRMLSDRMADFISGPVLVRGASPPQVLYVGAIAKLLKEQPYLGIAGGGGQPVAVWGQDTLEALYATGPDIWTLSNDDTGAHQLSQIAIGTPPFAGTLIVDGLDLFVAQPAPLVMISDGGAALAVVRGGRLEIDYFSAMWNCR